MKEEGEGIEMKAGKEEGVTVKTGIEEEKEKEVEVGKEEVIVRIQKKIKK